MAPLSARVSGTVWRAFWGSRLVVLFAGVAAVLQIGIPGSTTSVYDPSGLTTPFSSYLANALVAPVARWDSVWYLTIAKLGYGGVEERMAFFPLYPGLMRAVGWVTRSDLVAGVLISLVAFVIALVLLEKLVSLDFPEDVARMTVMLIAFSPMAFFFSAVYTEALFLALSLGSIYAARRERWPVAGVLGGLAAMSRNGGAALIVPLAWIFYEQHRRLRLSALWLLLVPAGLGVYLGYLGVRYGQALAPFRAEIYWDRHSTFPLVTVWNAAEQVFNGVRQLLDGPVAPYHVPAYAQGVTAAAFQDIYLFVFLILGVVALIGGLRRLPVAYSLYTLVMLLLALADPVGLQPLASLPRYELVVFPIFIWGAQLVIRRRWVVPAVAVSAVLLGLFAAEFATWRWVA